MAAILLIFRKEKNKESRGRIVGFYLRHRAAEARRFRAFILSDAFGTLLLAATNPLFSKAFPSVGRSTTLFTTRRNVISIRRAQFRRLCPRSVISVTPAISISGAASIASIACSCTSRTSHRRKNGKRILSVFLCRARQFHRRFERFPKGDKCSHFSTHFPG